MKKALHWIDDMVGIPYYLEDWLILIGIAIGIPAFVLWLLVHCDLLSAVVTF